jgi:hypothetical protein
MNVGKTTIRNNEIRNNAPVPFGCPGSELVLAIRIRNYNHDLVKLLKINTFYSSSMMAKPGSEARSGSKACTEVDKMINA